MIGSDKDPPAWAETSWFKTLEVELRVGSNLMMMEAEPWMIHSNPVIFNSLILDSHNSV